MLKEKRKKTMTVVSILLNLIKHMYLAESSGLQTKPKHRFQLKNKEREMYMESFRKMQELKVSSEDN